VSFSQRLRCELSDRARHYAAARSLPHSLSYGEKPVVCFEPQDGFLHGNFLPASYKAITANRDWRRRLAKVHTAARRSLPQREHGRWRELDSCVSSDALLMNVFCYPRLLTDSRITSVLGLPRALVPRFGVPARVPLAADLWDRTEIDMRLGNLLVEAKLTESGFQSAGWPMLARYRDFLEVFEVERLPRSRQRFHSYQLIRNVLAAHATHSSFCALLDARRPNLMDAVYVVLKCVRPVELRTSCSILTWQELARALPTRLRAFLAEKYGID
jgi:Restriction Endonuclease associating with ARP